MKERKNDITDMQKLAETGWKQMHETLIQRGLSSDVSVLSASSKKRNLFLFIAACIFSVLIYSLKLFYICLVFVWHDTIGPLQSATTGDADLPFARTARSG